MFTQRTAASGRTIPVSRQAASRSRDFNDKKDAASVIFGRDRLRRALLALVFAAPLWAQSPAGTFESAVAPVLQKSCYACHNAQLASGGLNLKSLATAAVAANRDDWETVADRVRAGEMPPPGVPKPAGLDGLAAFLDREFERLDRNTKPDPGRITARRMNRAEYRNTVRDLLGIDFQTAYEFPVDDSGDGFDNLGAVLSLSPLHAEKYLSAAERLAARALGLSKLPPKPLSASYADDEHYSEVVGFTGTNGSAKRVGNSFIEVTHRVDYDGDYVIIAGLAGNRGPEGKPVTMGWWMDGKLLYSEEIQTTPPKTVYFAPYEKREFKVFLPEGVHRFRLGFMNDEAGARQSKEKAFDPKTNKYPQMIGFLGPERPAADATGRKRILLCDPASGAGCAERIVSTLARRAFRRPVTKAEVAALMNLVEAARKEGLDAEHAIATALEAILVSPDFLFRVERDPAGAAGQVRRVTDVEMASRLSYFLWSSMPDDELLALAEAGKLSAPQTLEAQVKRMLADPKSEALSDNFAGQWLETRNLESVTPDPDKFPDWSAELKEGMRSETRMFFDHILRENRPIAEFLNARYTFLNEAMAKFYGIGGVTGPEFRRVELTDNRRGGVLGHAGVLAVSSYPTRTSVVLRGKYILDNILGTPPPAPPADVPPIDEEAVGTSVSLRQQMEKHRSDATCASCHAKMDPLGFALENYDAIGKWRTMDGKFPVDSTGTLPDGSSFSGPAEMRESLTRKLPQFAECLVRKMLTYALGRGIEAGDRRTVAAIAKNWSAREYRLQELVYEIVKSAPFQSRRAEPAKENAR
jgi:mono/diheme cytochrome c family protein